MGQRNLKFSLIDSPLLENLYAQIDKNGTGGTPPPPPPANQFIADNGDHLITDSGGNNLVTDT